MYKELLKQILKYDKITIFRHISPDGDCMFSALALYTFLKDNFKDKKIKVGGKDKFDLINKADVISDKFIMDSLAIVVDTSNTARIDDFRAMAAKYVIKIDHHPVVDEFGDLNYQNPQAAAACEVLSDILFSKTFAKYPKSKKVCEYLYCGLVTDTQNFRTSNTTYRTLQTASMLARLGDLKPSDLVCYTIDKDLNNFNKASKFRTLLKTKGSFGYMKLKQSDLNYLGTSANEAKNFIDEIGTIKDLNVWCVACLDKDNTYETSLRSKRGYVINDVAAMFGGGGHANAAGAKNLSSKQVDQMFEKLIEISTKKSKKH